MERNANIYYNADGILVDAMEGKTSFSNQPANFLYKKTIVA